MQDTMVGDEGVCWIATALGRGNLPQLEQLYFMGCPNVRAYPSSLSLQLVTRPPCHTSGQPFRFAGGCEDERRLGLGGHALRVAAIGWLVGHMPPRRA